MLSERWERGEDGASNRAIADRHLQVNEKLVRQYREGKKHVPLGVLFALPEDLARELAERAIASRSGGQPHRLAAAQLRRSLDRLANVPESDREEIFDSLIDAQKRITELIARHAPRRGK